MIKNRRFSNQDIPSEIDTEYLRCNFSHTNPIEKDGKWIGVRLFPGDDTPRTFKDCNLLNCEVPPGSIVIKCNTSIVRPAVFQNTDGSIIIDGETLTLNTYKRIVYGKWTSSGCVYYDEPQESEFDKVE